MECAAVIEAVPTPEAEQQAEVMHLEQVHQHRRVRPREQLLDVLEEPLATHVSTEEPSWSGRRAHSASAGCREFSADSSSSATVAKIASRASAAV